MPPTAVSEERHARPFAEFLLAQGRGRLAAELAEKLDELTQAVHITGKAGSLTLQIQIKPLDKGNTDVLTVTDKVALKLPSTPVPPQVFFVDADLHLVQNDPQQLSLQLHEVPTERPAASDLKDAKALLDELT